MSGSPKYSQATFASQVNDRIAAQRRQHAAEEARRRKAREEELRRQHIQQKAQVREAQAQAAQKVLADVRARMTAMGGDEVVLQWCAAGLREAGSLLDQADAEVRRGGFAAVGEICRRADAEMEALLSRAQERQLQEERRAYLIQSLMAALGQQNFLVSEPRMASTDDYESAVIIHAQRTDHRAIQIHVPPSCDVSYEIDGYTKRLEPAVGGTATTCDDAETQIDALHAQLDADFGVQMGELRWDGRDPTRRHKGGRPLPSATQATRGRGQP